jgi:hypothetical protein
MIPVKLLAKVLNRDADRTIAFLLSDPGVQRAFRERAAEIRAVEDGYHDPSPHHNED